MAEILVGCHKYPPYASGGLAPYLQRSLAALGRRYPELSLTLVTLRYPEGQPPRQVTDDGVLVLRPWLPGMLRRRFLVAERDFAGSGRWWFGATMAWFNLVLLVRAARGRHRYDLLAVHDWQSSPAGIVASLLLRLPVAYHIHNTEFTMTEEGAARDPGGLIRRCERTLGRLARVVVVPTPEMRDLLVRHGWDSERLAVVPHGFEAETSAARGNSIDHADSDRLRRRLQIPDRARVLVFVGRLSKVKGVHTLLQALPIVHRRHPDVRLVMLGVGFPGTDESRLVHERISSLGLGPSTHVYDAYLSQDEVSEHHAMADVCVFPSTFEPFGLVSVEAMAAGRPVVLGRGFSDLIALDDGRPVARRTRNDDPAELASTLIDLLDDPEAAEALGERGRRHVRDHLSWAASASALLERYDAVAAFDLTDRAGAAPTAGTPTHPWGGVEPADRTDQMDRIATTGRG